MMFNSFGSSLWMMPFSRYCRPDSKYWKHFSDRTKEDYHVHKCDDREYRLNYSGWPTNIINIELPTIHGKRCGAVFSYFVTNYYNLATNVVLH